MNLGENQAWRSKRWSYNVIRWLVITNRTVKLTGKYCRCRPFVTSVWTRSSPSSPILRGTRTSDELPVSRKTRALSSSNKMPRGGCCRRPTIDRHAVAMLNVYKMKAGPGLGLQVTSIGWLPNKYLGRLNWVSGRNNWVKCPHVAELDERRGFKRLFISIAAVIHTCPVLCQCTTTV